MIRRWRTWIVVALIVLALAMTVGTFRTYRAPAGSMAPTIPVGRPFLVNLSAYALTLPFTDRGSRSGAGSSSCSEPRYFEQVSQAGPPSFAW